MRINPFIICDVAEQARYRQMADLDVWLHKCAVLGVGEALARPYDTLACAYAMTTTRPNSEVIASCRSLALDALSRGDPMPDTPEEAVEAENARRMVQLLDPEQAARAAAERLRKCFHVED